MNTTDYNVLIQYGNIPNTITVNCFEDIVYEHIKEIFNSSITMCNDSIYPQKYEEEEGGYIFINIDITNKVIKGQTSLYIKEIIAPLINTTNYVVSYPFY